MTGPRSPRVVARVDAVLTLLREDGGTMRCNIVASRLHESYGLVFHALGYLAREGLVERVGQAEMTRRVEFGGRVVYLAPEASAVGWRAVTVTAEVLAGLEAMWDLPAVDR